MGQNTGREDSLKVITRFLDIRFYASKRPAKMFADCPLAWREFRVRLKKQNGDMLGFRSRRNAFDWVE